MAGPDDHRSGCVAMDGGRELLFWPLKKTHRG
jgi:hypothetical protein